MLALLLPLGARGESAVVAPEVLVANGEQWAVATGHPLATEAGAEVLRKGGNAIDAAVAASLALGVAEPYGSGLGGKLVLLYCDGKTGEVSGIEALCPAPAALDPPEFAALSRADRRYGFRSVCVPGLPAGLAAAHAKWGAKPWRELVMPAAELADAGVAVSAEQRQLYVPHARQINAAPEVAQFYAVDGATPDVGDVLVNADLAATLRLFAEGGRDGFYRGETAERIVEACHAAGSPMSLEDFASYKPRFTQPLAVGYRGYRVYSSPPPLTGGVTVLGLLAAQEATAWPEGKARDAAYIHGLCRLLRPLYPRISRVVADVPSAEADAWALLGEASIDRAREKARRPAPADRDSAPAGFFSEPTLDDRVDASTSHLVVVDRENNLVSLTQSLSLHFGACAIAPGTGVLLNDSMSNFATATRSSVNYVRGGKRPRSTVAPVVVTRDGVPVLTLGIPGGQRIPTTTAQLLVDVLGGRVQLDEAFRRPRFHLRRATASRQPTNQIDLEAEFPPELDEQLEELGWRVSRKESGSSYFGGGNAAMLLPGGRLVAVADPRRTNSAAAE
ncbi:MAG: gamma-glutamyltransferase family protein [Planctomycetota bacterium]